MKHQLQRFAASLQAKCQTKYQTIRAYCSKHPRKSVALIAAGVLVAVPIITMGYLLATNSINVPFWDQWIYVDLVNKWHQGTLGFGDLWHQHNEHRIFFPKLLQVLLASVTGWNVRIEVMSNFFIGLASFGLMIALLRRTFAGKVWPLLLGAFLTAWLFFSPVQYINWIWGFQLAWFFSVLAVVFTIWCLTKYDPKNRFDRWFWLGLSGALIATFSMGNGMVIWPIGIGLLLYKQVARQPLVAWTGTGAVAVGLYFFHLARPEQPSPLWLLRHRLHDLTEYTLQYLGRNLAFTPSSARNSGIVLLVLLAVSLVLLARRKKIAPVLPWLAIGSYGLITAVLAAFSRMYAFGVDHSMVHSYTTMSVLFVIGVFITAIYTGVVYMERATAAQLRRFLVAGFALGVLAFPFVGNFWYNYTDGARELKGLGLHMSHVRDCVFHATSKEDPCLDIVYPGRSQAWDYIQTLKHLNWDHLRDDTQK